MDIKKAAFIEAQAGVRYWEDATVNGVKDEDGSRIPCRSGETWSPTIELATGKVVGWTEGVTADVHYKVCDDGAYWLLDAGGKRIAKHKSDYVPGDFMCHGDNGYGDYIIMNIGPDGQIADYSRAEIVHDEWLPV